MEGGGMSECAATSGDIGWGATAGKPADSPAPGGPERSTSDTASNMRINPPAGAIQPAHRAEAV
jgi:hypothetical protein